MTVPENRWRKYKPLSTYTKARLYIARSCTLPCGVLNKYRVEIEELYYHSRAGHKEAMNIGYGLLSVHHW